ncbi:hypothetical protein CYY_001440 [Polysphondylium violaceum]|uniref:Cytochrome P450 family protein n=1 Tax=Polysphondylium violaceum TaxID=133409 RepID=A0A8J4UW69_9MYCE|nr:hypothetical protein CYY_001440 [Polysphondylium violaceum]
MNILYYLFYIFLVYIFYKYFQKFKNYGPKSLKGPIPLPFFGNLLSLAPAPHVPLIKYHQQYGPVFRVWMGDTYTVVLNDVDIIKQIYVKNFQSSNAHPDTPSFHFYSDGYQGLVLSCEHDWKEKRDIVAKSLAKTKIKHLYSLLDNQVGNLIDAMGFHVESGLPFAPRKNIQRFIMNSMLRFIMDKEIPYDHQLVDGQEKSKMEGLLHHCDEVFADLGAGKLGDYIDILKPLLALYIKKSNKSLKKIIDIIHEEYIDHQNTFTEQHKTNPRDFLDVLIGEYLDDDKTNIQSIIFICFDIILAGTDTTSGTLEWCVLYLANYPEYQEMAYKELSSLIGKERKAQLSDRTSTPFLNAFIKESSRIKPVGAFGIPRMATQDIELQDYFIPKGAQILINYCGIARNPKYFKDAYEFNPHRFINSNQDFSMYGYGSRNCVGQLFANDHIYLALSNIILKYKISPTNGKKIDDSDVFGLTILPKEFNINLEERL